MAPWGRHCHEEIDMKRSTSLVRSGHLSLNLILLVDLCIRDIWKWKSGRNPPLADFCHLFVLVSRPSYPGCRLISLAHLWSLFLSSSCTRKMSASVNLLILYAKEPVRGKRLSPQYRALRDLLKPSSFLLSIPLMWHKSLQKRKAFSILSLLYIH